MFDQSTHVFVSYQCNGFIFVLLDRPPIWKKAPSGVFVGIYVTPTIITKTSIPAQCDIILF